ERDGAESWRGRTLERIYIYIYIYIYTHSESHSHTNIYLDFNLFNLLNSSSYLREFPVTSVPSNTGVTQL
ncbi:hypothetical protein LSH36_1827g00005, partial [Paralvinella palmiformis]